MRDSRDNVLAVVARGVRVGALPPDARLEHPGAPPDLARASDREGMIASFVAELGKLAGSVHRVASDAEAIATVRSLLNERSATRVLAWDDAWLQPAGIGDALRRDGITMESCALPADAAGRAARLQALDPVLVGLTGAHAALADTGSVVVVSGPGRGRIASLLPPTHIAVVRADQFYPSLGPFLAANASIAEVGANMVVITGPSRTGDIEGTLVLGVHGPGDLHVVLIG
jgi:L-lactate dehydrogenase complex protein LldG